MKKTIILLLLIFIISRLFAQTTEHLSITTFLDRDSYSISDTIKIALKINIKEKYHINSVSPFDESFIKTEITSKSEEFKIINTFFPPHEMYKFAFSDTEIPVYEGNIIAGVTMIGLKDLKAGNYTIPIDFTYQACDNAACYPPKTVKSEIKIILSKTGNFINKEIFSKINFSSPVVSQNVQKESQIKENERTESPNKDEEKYLNSLKKKE